jgi:hypothetical protein
MNTDVAGGRSEGMRIMLLVFLVSIVVALGALELAASRLASEELHGREGSLPAPTWLAH